MVQNYIFYIFLRCHGAWAKLCPGQDWLRLTSRGCLQISILNTLVCRLSREYVIDFLTSAPKEGKEEHTMPNATKVETEDQMVSCRWEGFAWLSECWCRLRSTVLGELAHSFQEACLHSVGLQVRHSLKAAGKSCARQTASPWARRIADTRQHAREAGDSTEGHSCSTYTNSDERKLIWVSSMQHFAVDES